jgi:nitroimidazol reductase NimA-like FMN-containing flavoprotein (pyridoxamine 5'-phosphate oxidase superfamily)
MRGIRRKEKEITDINEMIEILEMAQHITIAMCKDNEPYLATLSHGYDRDRHCIYFHCATDGKKIDILSSNNLVWGQALVDKGYVQGACDHLYATTQFKGTVTFVKDKEEKIYGLKIMIRAIDDNPDSVMAEQITDKSVARVEMGRIDIEYMSGKKANKVIISL